MIRCAKCGAINPDNSRFCNTCGAPLQRTQIRCPVCNTLNPAGNVFCDKCHARLIPADAMMPRQPAAAAAQEPEEPVRSISLPVRSDLGKTGELGDLPDWMTGLIDETPIPATESQPEFEEKESAAEAVELPDWLLGILPSEEEKAAPTAEAAEEEAGLPDWLSGIAAPAPEVAAPAAEEEAGLPDWLSGLAAPAPEAAPPAAEEEAGLPDWLSGIAAPAPEAAAPAAEEEAGLPDWLSGIAAPAPEAAAPAAEEEAGLPDWLSGIAAPAPEAAAPVAEEEEAALPDWLSSIAAPGTTVEAGREELIIEGPVPAGAGLWLPGVEEEAAAAPTVGESTEAVPDWLKALAPQDLPSAPDQGAFLIPETEEEESVEPFVPDLTPAPTPRKPTTDELARANVPEWLRALRPEDSFGEVASAGATGSVFTDAAALEDSLDVLGGELVRAEIPEWLQELKPTGAPRPEGMTLEQFITQATETEGGPLSGMKGLLQPEAVVDIPADYQPVPRYDLPSVVLERAKLWQTLLEQPRSAQRKMARQRMRPGFGETLARWIIALALLTVIFWTVLGFPVPVQAPLPSSRGLTDFVQTVESLNAGDRVLVALEYGPAEEAEMRFLVEPLLGHLAAREVAVDWVTTLPEGVGLINSLKMDPAWQQSWKTPGYLPGTTTGIAMYLTMSKEAGQRYDLLIVLAARSDHLRWWIEQNTVGPRLPVLAGLNNAVGSLMIPYLDIENLKGVLTGAQDGAAYLAQRSGGTLAQYPLQQRQLNAWVGTQWVAMFLLIAGTLWTVITRKKGAA